jgi:hypothetical protein
MRIREAGDAGAVKRGHFTYFPVVPGRIDFALRLRRYLLEHRPKVVAVELPWRLENHYARAVDRMPQMSVILVPEDRTEEDEAAVYIPVEPGDPFIEALRTARELEADAHRGEVSGSVLDR